MPAKTFLKRRMLLLLAVTTLIVSTRTFYCMAVQVTSTHVLSQDGKHVSFKIVVRSHREFDSRLLIVDDNGQMEQLSRGTSGGSWSGRFPWCLFTLYPHNLDESRIADVSEDGQIEVHDDINQKIYSETTFPIYANRPGPEAPKRRYILVVRPL